jgi:hypothetical protein
MEFPFKEKKTQSNISIREFRSDVDSSELIWHRDKEDRIVEVLQNNNWMFQMDNELPKLLKEKLFIPKETYHRVIKGDGDLVVKITKLGI